MPEGCGVEIGWPPIRAANLSVGLPWPLFRCLGAVENAESKREPTL